mgnify:CR=1 FL=1
MKLFNNPYGTRNNGHTMITDKIKKKHKRKTKRDTGKTRGEKRRESERKRLRAKADSPGVPANTCPYIDLVQTMITDLQAAYDRCREKGEHNPMVDRLATQATDMLEYIRANNETLRDNSAYWYGQYKSELKR